MGSKTRTFIVLLSMLMVLVACGDSAEVSVATKSSDVVGVAADHTAHTDIADGIWPPQPVGIQNVEGYPASARASAELSVIDSALRALMNNPDTRAALGDNFRQFDGSLGDSKSDITASFLFYNYTSNTTVEARLTKAGNVENDLFPASEWQPPEHSAEVTQAIELAENSLNTNGFETAGLAGSALLAFPPISQITGNDQQYYAERILYVTFGEGDGAVPVYSALVNVSNGTVTESGLVR